MTKFFLGELVLMLAMGCVAQHEPVPITPRVQMQQGLIDIQVTHVLFTLESNTGTRISKIFTDRDDIWQAQYFSIGDHIKANAVVFISADKAWNTWSGEQSMTLKPGNNDIALPVLEDEPRIGTIRARNSNNEMITDTWPLVVMDVETGAEVRNNGIALNTEIQLPADRDLILYGQDLSNNRFSIQVNTGDNLDNIIAIIP